MALVAYAPRYATVAREAGLAIEPPDSVAAFEVIERLDGSATTDFGALSRVTDDDRRPLTAPEIDRLTRLLSACWLAFDAALARIPAATRSVKPKARRSPAAMRQHLLETDVMHLSAFGPAYRKPPPEAIDRLEPQTRAALVQAIEALPTGPPVQSIRRYGFDWTPRFAIRRSAWHALDHAWQLDDERAAAS